MKFKVIGSVKPLISPLLLWGALINPAFAAAGDATPAPEEAVQLEAAPPAEGEPQQGAEREQTFTIKRFVIEGSALFSREELARALAPFTGRKRTSADVEGARDALESFFHEKGYPTVLVNIPEQTLQNKVVRLQVIENRVGSVNVTGNRWFSTEKVLRDLPSIAPGSVIYLPQLQQEANRVNRNPDFKIVPEMKPGKSPETVDMNVTVTDQSPWHGSLEANNRSSHDTTESRLLASLRYDNLWQREHSLSGSFQISPEKTSEVKVASGSYTMPAPWQFEDKMVLYGVWSDSKTAFSGGFKNLGKGFIVGGRGVLQLAPFGSYSHSAVLGLDYKDFQETSGMLDVEAGDEAPVKYLPVSAAYSAQLVDGSGVTSFNAGLNLSFRGMVSDPREFEQKRYRSRANYLTLTAGVERNQQLPGDFSLLVKVDGQVADQPLISNEQYVAGGVESVRGYKESEGSGDNAVHAGMELAAPDLVGSPRARLVPYLFLEGAGLWVKSPLPGQDPRIGLMGTGLGVRGVLFGSLEYQADLGFALRDTAQTELGDPRLHLKVKWQF